MCETIKTNIYGFRSDVCSHETLQNNIHINMFVNISDS